MNREDLKSIGMLLLIALLAVVFTFSDQICGMLTTEAGSMVESLLK